MKNVLIIYRDPKDIGCSDEIFSQEDLLMWCFSIRKYETEAQALMAYAETPCMWSTLVEECNWELFVKEAAYRIWHADFDWLERNFV